MSETVRPRGRPPKLVGEYKVFPLRLPEDLHHRLKLLATNRKESLNDLVCRVLTEFWEQVEDRAAYEKLSRPEGVADRKRKGR